MENYDIIINELNFKTLEYHEGEYVYLMAEDPENGTMLLQEMGDGKGIILHSCSFEKNVKIKVLNALLEKSGCSVFCNVSKNDLYTKLVPLKHVLDKLNQPKEEEWGLD